MEREREREREREKERERETERERERFLSKYLEDRMRVLRIIFCKAE